MRECTEKQKKTRGLSIAVALIVMLLASLAAGSRRNQGYSLGDYSAISLQEQLEKYRESEQAEDLVLLLKVLCYQAEAEESAEAKEMIKVYGTELLDLAKKETIDLQKMGEADEELLELLKLIRKYGAA